MVESEGEGPRVCYVVLVSEGSSLVLLGGRSISNTDRYWAGDGRERRRRVLSAWVWANKPFVPGGHFEVCLGGGRGGSGKKHRWDAGECPRMSFSTRSADLAEAVVVGCSRAGCWCWCLQYSDGGAPVLELKAVGWYEVPVPESMVDAHSEMTLELHWRDVWRFRLGAYLVCCLFCLSSGP